MQTLKCAYILTITLVYTRDSAHTLGWNTYLSVPRSNKHITKTTLARFRADNQQHLFCLFNIPTAQNDHADISLCFTCFFVCFKFHLSTVQVDGHLQKHTSTNSTFASHKLDGVFITLHALGGEVKSFARYEMRALNIHMWAPRFRVNGLKMSIRTKLLGLTTRLQCEFMCKSTCVCAHALVNYIHWRICACGACG